MSEYSDTRILDLQIQVKSLEMANHKLAVENEELLRSAKVFAKRTALWEGRYDVLTQMVTRDEVVIGRLLELARNNKTLGERLTKKWFDEEFPGLVDEIPAGEFIENETLLKEYRATNCECCAGGTKEEEE